MHSAIRPLTPHQSCKGTQSWRYCLMLSASVNISVLVVDRYRREHPLVLVIGNS